MAANSRASLRGIRPRLLAMATTSQYSILSRIVEVLSRIVEGKNQSTAFFWIVCRWRLSTEPSFPGDRQITRS
jgi:hypothetical protein